MYDDMTCKRKETMRIVSSCSFISQHWFVLYWVWLQCWIMTVVEAQRGAWNLGLRSNSNNGSSNHVSLGRMSLSPTCFRTSPSNICDSCDLDVTKWQQAHPANDRDYYQVAAASSDSTAMASLRTRVRTRRPQKVIELEEEVEGSSAEILHELTQPLVKEDIWENLNGQEFNHPSMIEAMTRTGLFMASGKDNDWVTWKAADKTTSQAQEDGTEEQVLQEGGVLVYLGKWRKDGYGSNVPVVKSVSIINMSPKDMAELLLDSSRVTTYNKMSQGRKDVRVMQKGVDTHDHFGHGETKIVRNITKPPVAKKKMLSVTLMHGRALRPTDGVQEGGYVLVSRAVGDPGVETQDYTLSEILLGVNVLRTEAPNQCRVTAVTHVYSPNLPTVLASRIGIKGAVNFVRDIRTACGDDNTNEAKVVASN